MAKEKRIRISIKTKLLAIALLPPLILSVVLTIMSGSNIQAGMQEEALKGLRGAAMSLMEIYETADSGEYVSDADGNVTKGKMAVSGDYAIVDTLKAATEYDVTVFYGDTRVTTSLKNKETGERLVGTKASEQVIQTVLKEGKEYSDTAVVINGAPYYGYYVPLVQNDTVIGMVFAGSPSGDVNSFIQSKVSGIIGVSATVLIILVIIGLVFALNLGKAITRTEKVLHEVGKGNLQVSVDKRSKKRGDEIGDMAREMESLVASLVNIIGDVKKSSGVLLDKGVSLDEMATHTNNTTSEIGRAVSDISKGAMNQAEESETATINVNQIGEIITEIVERVDQLGQVSADMKNASDESTVIIGELGASNDRTTEAIAKISQQVHTTNDSVQEIRQAVEMITDIATETNLLSLNASIEAARAGEHGRGFSVVASQIQKLAEESSKSATEIQKIIDTLLKDSEQTVMVMDEVNIIVNEQRDKLNQTRDKFKLVTAGVNATREETAVIEKQVAACDAARAKIVDVIQNLSAISEENAASTEETNASMEELNANIAILSDSAKSLMELSTELENDMGFFHL